MDINDKEEQVSNVKIKNCILLFGVGLGFNLCKHHFKSKSNPLLF